jgi:hypothetical protein
MSSYCSKRHTRTEIIRHAKHVRAADSDDFYRWVIAWVWFAPVSDDLVCSVMLAAGTMGRKGMTADGAEALIAEAGRTPRQMNADDLAAWLGVDFLQREALGFRRIGARDIKKTAREVLRKLRAARAVQKRRRAKGVQPRRQYEQNSLSRIKPWEATSMSRAKWYRLRKAELQTRETSLSIIYLPTTADTSVSTAAASPALRLPMKDFASLSSFLDDPLLPASVSSMSFDGFVQGGGADVYILEVPAIGRKATPQVTVCEVLAA